MPTADYPPIEGGISTLALHVSRELASLGHKVIVVAPYFPDMETFDRDEPVRVVRFRGYNTGWLRLAPMMYATRPHLAGADLVLAINATYGGIIAWRAYHKHGVPYLAFAYAYEFLKFEKTPNLRRLLRKIYADARRIIAISRFTRDRLVEFGVSGEKIDVVFPGASTQMLNAKVTGEDVKALRREYGLGKARIILAVGRVIERKGFLTLVLAMPAILENNPRTKLVIVGRGPDLAHIQDMVKHLNATDHVVFIPPVAEDTLAILYALCDVFALPTGTAPGGQVEGFGLVFVEAQAFGKPVVAGRSGGVKDAVIDGVTGLLVEPEDHEQLADAITRVLDDKGLAKRLGDAGRERVETELNWTVFTRRTIEAAGFGDTP